MISILKENIQDKNIISLLQEIIFSFEKGLPLGNLTSQLFANVFLNEFDQFVKHKLKAKHYIRYADDFVIFSQDKEYLESLIPQMQNFLQSRLKLDMHPDKVFIKTLASGMDFLGWVHFFDHRVLRTATKKRMLRKVGQNPSRESINSYLGMLGHGNCHKISDFLFKKDFTTENFFG